MKSSMIARSSAGILGRINEIGLCNDYLDLIIRTPRLMIGQQLKHLANSKEGACSCRQLCDAVSVDHYY